MPNTENNDKNIWILIFEGGKLCLGNAETEKRTKPQSNFNAFI